MAIDEFKSLVSAKQGIARSNLFRVILPALPGASSREVNLLCKNVTLPGRQIITSERRIGVKTEKIPYGFLIDDVSMTFHLLNDYGIKNYFETWQSLAMNQNTYEIGYQRGPGGYSCNIQIQQLEKGIGSIPFFSTNIGFVNFSLNLFANVRPVYTCTLIDAFPTTMNNISLNNEMDGLSELTVQLSYTDWKPGVVSASNTNASAASSKLNTGLALLNRFINLPLGDFGNTSLVAKTNASLPTGLTNLFRLFT